MERRILSEVIGKTLLNNSVEGDLKSNNNRVAFWSYFIVENTELYVGKDKREYLALTLPGEFYSKDTANILIKPHVEIQKEYLDTKSNILPLLIAETGNCLLAPLWLVSEVKAYKSALNKKNNNYSELLIQLISSRRNSLIEAYLSLTKKLVNQFHEFNEIMYEDPEGTSNIVYADIASNELYDLIPVSPAINLKILFSGKLKNAHPSSYIQRIGVWEIEFRDSSSKVNAVALTPRLTYNSLFKDENYQIQTESNYALLIRVVLLKRITKLLSINVNTTIEKDFVKNEKYFFKTIPIKNGLKSPVPSDSAVLNFIVNNDSPENAWDELTAFASDRLQLVNDFVEFEEVFLKVKNKIKHMETIELSDKNVILPIAWSKNGPVRITYVKPKS